ncbi:hypothetical protein BJF92_18620 [Rhizobium rhizosphaerae]|uniref:DUF6456 domain-containing protein n=1 Tax=Xaviernesmea rhizosphaerae TaxID=1672749 RepID=A0A1Q9ADQ1_9HYPH|nr:DUF6456 domain-containing protein [Xaviernesmea rhizosphaerae]OLP53049.1 hypothetical protein BJF92_18620 [Xaviernesmea rhizosphaerae]OQP87387.1 hypothetical protein BTR14_05485 [Xaviernesmea rhizosphaerae]
MLDRRERMAWTALLRFVSRGGPFTLGPPDAQGRETLSDAKGKHAVARALLARAISCGLLTRRGGQILVRPEAAAHLRRQLAPQEEAFAAQHGARERLEIATEDGRATVTVNRAESPLALLSRLKEKSGGPFLPEEACAAATRLHADFTRGGLQPRLTMDYSPRMESRPGGAGAAAPEISDSAMAARLRVAAAIEAIGPELSGVALDVCCFEKGLETVERERQWPARSAKLLLRAALLALARHYQPPPRRRGAHRWQAGAQD